MTREEAINRIIEIDIRGPLQEDYDALNMAIKALKQEPILDKIRTEIKDIAFDSQLIDGEHKSIMILELNDALNIIDKYKAESEE